MLDLQVQIRRTPKPVIAMVAGYAIGGGHVLHVCCDLTIAADNAVFGQTGPEGRLVRRRLRLLAAGRHRRAEEGPGDLVPVPPVQRARRRWRWAWSTTVVPLDKLEEETVAWARELLEKSPLALRMLKGALNAVTDGAAGMQQFAGDATLLYYMSEEAQEGRDAFKEKRPPDFAQVPAPPVTEARDRRGGRAARAARRSRSRCGPGSAASPSGRAR